MSLRIQDEGRFLSQFNSSELDQLETEWDRKLIRYDIQHQQHFLEHLNRQTYNTAEQQLMFNYALQSLRNERTTFIFIRGMGGSGKSTLTKLIMEAARGTDI